ncbi:MAG: LysM peptidoglycan-binding domain-containing protein, partial [Gallionella sp.]|nr:LysM peptidoglycan-binding domain-containing protein [Gallionella sp.]
GNITVTRGDTLSKIAAQNKSADVSLERMLVAMYRANAEQFDGKNMNRIRAGKILRLPDQGELMNVAQSDATKEIRAQVADWNTYRQKLASAAAVASQSQDAQQVATGKITSSIADRAPVAKESAKEVLKLSKGEAPGDQAAAGAIGKSASAEGKKNAAQENAIAKAKASKEEQARAVLLEKNLKDMQRLAQLKSEAAASEVAAASAVKPKPVAKPKPKVVEPEPSLLDQILGEPLYLAGGVAVLLGLGGIGFMLNRRRQTSVSAIRAQGEATSAITHIAAPVTPSPDTGDFTSAAATSAEQAAHQPDEVDPISEADLFLNFGRDAQAEEILKEALRNTPNNHQIHLKLLGIYANRKDANSFSAIARQLQDSGDEEAWQQAAAMGRKLEPNNPMYSGAGTLEDADSATMQTTALGATPGAAHEASASEVDFDLGMSSEESAALPEQEFLADTESTTALNAADTEAAKVATMDFDVTSTSPSLATPIGMDFDITSTSPSMPAAAGQAEKTASSDMDDLIFDITSTHLPTPAAQPELAKPSEPAQADGGMEFTLDFPIEDVAEKPAPATQPTDAGLAGISLNLDDIAEPNESAPEAKDEHWHEVATKLDLARAYQEMGDATGAREILEEVLREGDEGQREAAQSLLNQLS